MFKSILIPIDASSESQGAAMLGLEFAKKVQANVRVIHVTEPPIMYPSQVETVSAETLRQQGLELLQPWLRHAQKLGVQCETELIQKYRAGIGEAIVAAADDANCDLIVMGTHGREGLGRLVLGSVAERVSRLATQPVMLVRQNSANSKKPPAFERLFVPVDGSDTSDMAIRLAGMLSTQLPASLEIVHVVPDLPIPLGDPVGAYAAFDYAGLAKTLEESGREIVAKALQIADGQRVSSRLIPAGKQRLATAILKAAQESSSDLIVIGTHGRSGFDRLLLGSVAEGVIHHAEVPVLLVRLQAVART